MKSLYLCKCGKSFYKSTEAATTGFRLPDYGPGRECYGCPFVYEVPIWDPAQKALTVKTHECRASKTLRYDTTAGINTADKCTAHIFTLDFEFLREIHKFAETLDGFEPDRYFFDHRSALYGADGRYRYTLYPVQNQKGIAAKKAIFEKFFRPDGIRKDLSPEQEKAKILGVIAESKREARLLNTYYAPCGQKFNRSAGRASEITIEVTGTTAKCFSCPHATHKPGDDRQGPKTFCVCARKQGAASNREKDTETEKKETKHMGKLNLANISAGLSSVKSITENMDTLSHSEKVPAELIFPAGNNPYAVDDTPESLQALAESIRANGLIHPLAVNKISADEYRLISGERRFKAITQCLHWRTISCMVYDHISENSAKLKLHAANLEVRDYTTEQKLRFYEETSKLLHGMKESGEYTGPIQKGIAELLGVSDRQVRKYQTVTRKLSPERQQAVIRGEVSINDACRSVPSVPGPEAPEPEETGTGSGFSVQTAPPKHTGAEKDQMEPSAEHAYIDHEYWDGKILAALKCHYDPDDIYTYYLFQVPTTAEAVRDKLKPACGSSGGTVDFSEKTRGCLNARSQNMTIECGKHSVDLTYSQVDDMIRKAIRKGAWISADEAETIVLEKYSK